MEQSRIAIQRERVRNLMSDGEWRTLPEISAVTGALLTSASARLRDFRKKKFGGYRVERRARENRLFEYRVLWS